MVHGYEAFSEGISNLLNEEPSFNVESINCGKEASEEIKVKKYDLYLIDIDIPNKSSLKLTAKINRLQPNAKILISTADDFSPYFQRFMEIGICGCINYSMSSEQQIQTIKHVMNDQAALPLDLFKKIHKVKNEVMLDNGRTISLTELEEEILIDLFKNKTNAVIATKSGVLHYLQPVSTGMSLQQNQVIGEIATESDGFYVDSYIHAQDRSRIAVGQSVNVAIIGVNNYRFGTVTGQLEFIEPGTIQNETAEGVISLYRARISLNEELLTSKSGEEIELVRSMPVEARVVYQEETYLEWLLDLLNLKSK